MAEVDTYLLSLELNSKSVCFLRCHRPIFIIYIIIMTSANPGLLKPKLI